VKVSIILPSNNKEKTEQFIKQFNSLRFFRGFVDIVIIGNGQFKESPKGLWNKDCFIKIDEDYTDKIIPFAKLRGLGMAYSSSDWFLFLDDDHFFEEKDKREVEEILMKSLVFLDNHLDCGVLQLHKKSDKKSSFYIKKNAHIWTDRGLFIKRINFDYKKLSKLKGACEDLLYAYEVLNTGLLPYCLYNCKIKRGCNLPNDYKENNNESYKEKLLDENIIGYIRKKYGQDNWGFYGNLKYLGYPNFLRQMIKKQLTNLI